MSKDPDEWISLAAYAKHVGRTRNVVYNWVAKGHIPASQVKSVQAQSLVKRYVRRGTPVPLVKRETNTKPQPRNPLRIQGGEAHLASAWGAHAWDPTPVDSRLRDELDSALRLARDEEEEVKAIGRRNAVRTMAMELAARAGHRDMWKGARKLAKAMGRKLAEVKRWASGQMVGDSAWFGLILPLAQQRLQELTAQTRPTE